MPCESEFVEISMMIEISGKFFGNHQPFSRTFGWIRHIFDI
eukprot:UN06080